MREYAIEYADYNLLTRFGCIIGGYFILIFIMILSSNEIMFVWTTVLGILISLVYLLANPSRIRKNGVILMNSDRIVFGMASGIRVIELDKLAKCQVAHYDGPMLTLVLKNGSTFRIMANNNFCDTSKLEQACHDIEIVLYKFEIINQSV